MIEAKEMGNAYSQAIAIVLTASQNQIEHLIETSSMVAQMKDSHKAINSVTHLIRRAPHCHRLDHRTK